MNNLDPEVAERPEDLVVYGGTGKAARNWECFDAIVRALRELGDDETLLVQSGKPVGVFRTHEDAPRVLISNSMLVPAWATWEHFYELDRKGLMMYGQMTAGSWIYIGTQGILQGTYETFAEAARQHFGGSLAGRLVLTAGLGGMGGAQPLAATMNEGVLLAVEVDRAAHRAAARDALPRRVARDRRRGARARARGARRRAGRSRSACSATPPTSCPSSSRRGVVPDLVTDQTSAHDPLNGYVPNRMSYEQALALRAADPARYMAEARRSDGRARAGDARPEGEGRDRLRLRQQHPRRGAEGRRRGRLRLPRLRARLHPAALLRGQGPVPLGLPLRRSRRHARDRRGRPRDLPATTRRSPAGSGWRASASSPRACRRASAGSATASARSWASSSTSWCARAG